MKNSYPSPHLVEFSNFTQNLQNFSYFLHAHHSTDMGSVNVDLNKIDLVFKLDKPKATVRVFVCSSL